MTDISLTRDQVEKILEVLGDGVTVQDCDGELVYVNPAAAAMMGFDSPAEVMAIESAAIVKRFEVFDEDMRPLSFNQFPGRLTVLGDFEPVRVIGFKILKTGRLVWTNVLAAPICIKKDEVAMVVNVMQDITRLKAVHARLQEANARITKLLDRALG